MTVILTFIQRAIMQGIPILFGASGEILTEKSGNLNLGIPGIMYMGGVSGLIAAFLYERAAGENAVGAVGLVLSLLFAILVAMLGGLIYSVLTVTLRANQNVVGLALTTFGVGFGNFFGGSLSQMAGGVGQISVKTTAAAYRAPVPGLSKIPVVGKVLFSYGFLTYLAFIIALVMTWFLLKTRKGLNLRAVGEDAATADAARVEMELLLVKTQQQMDEWEELFSLYRESVRRLKQHLDRLLHIQLNTEIIKGNFEKDKF